MMDYSSFAGGTFMSGVIGLFFRVVLGHKAWLARPLAVATSVLVLVLTATPFPPGMHALHDRPGYLPGVVCSSGICTASSGMTRGGMLLCYIFSESDDVMRKLLYMWSSGSESCSDSAEALCIEVALLLRCHQATYLSHSADHCIVELMQFRGYLHSTFLFFRPAHTID